MSESKPRPIYKQANLTLTSTSNSTLAAGSPGKDEKTPLTNKKKTEKPEQPAREIGGPEGPEPTRYGDWERNGRCVDF
jgi:hypothetical protein